MTEYTATVVEYFSQHYGSDFVVFQIFFEDFDPEKGGQSWSFQRALGADGTVESLSEEDEGVCIVKEIQQIVAYEEIDRFILERTRVACHFSDTFSQREGIDKLLIHLNISNAQWNELVSMARTVFRGREYFNVEM